MRGKHRSFALDEVVREAQLLEAQGAREVNLVAQDLAHYGRDRRDGFTPPRTARGARARDGDSLAPHALSLLLGDHAAAARGRWRASRASCRISTCRCSTRRTPCWRACAARSGSARSATACARSARSCPTSPSGRRASSAFPGETDDDFSQLMEFLEEIQFERVGAFTYSPQEGTRAAEMVDDVPES